MNPYLYTGRDYDPETGLRYYRARYYDPTEGRFLSEDALRFASDSNFYRYANNSPTVLEDPFGLAAAPALPLPRPAPAPGPTVISLEPAAIGYLFYYDMKLGIELTRTVLAINRENDSYAKELQTIGALNQFLLKRADERECEYQAYKKRCSEPTPLGLGPCEARMWELQRNMDCRDMRYVWDKKYQNGRHANDLLQLSNAIKKAQDWINRKCK